MGAVLLATKLYVPHPPASPVPRTRLLQALDGAVTRRLTLLSAPAGFGKTTLLTQWIHDRKIAVAWVSLDEGDNDLNRFLSYVVAALQTLYPHVGSTTLAFLQQSQSLRLEGLLAPLVNELAVLSRDSVLVLDDLHQVENTSVYSVLEFLLGHLPSPMHLVISSRAEPLLPLARLRAQGQLVELRAQDLRFLPEEAAAFLGESMGLTLTAEQISALETRTEGWIAGLQMAALSMRGQKDISAFIHAFTGSHRYIVDYLLEEVLRQQPEAVQAFLLRTCILERLSAPLCDAVTGQSNGTEILEALDRSNLFVIPLDIERRWYRYHHLFADVLRNRLQLTFSGEAGELHHRAAEWYEQNGLSAEAISHAFAAQDLEYAARLVEENAMSLLSRGELLTVQTWLDALESHFSRRPWLPIFRALALMSQGQWDAAQRALKEAERCLIANSSSPDAKEQRGYIVALQATLALFQGDAKRAAAFGRQALTDLPITDGAIRSLSEYALGSANRLEGQVADANEMLTQAAQSAQNGGHLHFAIAARSATAELLLDQGLLHRAAQVLEETLQASTLAGGARLPIAGRALFGLHRVSYEWNQLDAAAANALEYIELHRQWGTVDGQAIGFAMLARTRQAQRDSQGAAAALREADRFAGGHVLTPDRAGWMEAYRVGVWLAQGNWEACRKWRAACGIRPDSEILPLHEPEYMAVVRVLLALGETTDARQLLARLAQSPLIAGKTGIQIELSVLESLAFHTDVTARALQLVERALVLAEPAGYLRVFLDEGLPMVDLLRRAASRGIAPKYVATILAAFESSEDSHPARSQLLVEPLSKRELQVLQLAARGCSNQEIAAQLFIALGTVKAHLNNINSKLDSQTRTQAVARARDLHLLD